MMDSVFEQYDQQLLNAAEDNMASAFELLRSFPRKYLPRGNELILQHFSFPRIAAELAEKYWLNPFYISELLDVAGSFPFQKKEIKTIGMYYTKLYNGGAERVVCLLSNILCQAGYRVVVITDEAPDPRDYFLNDTVVRIVLSGTVPTDGKNAADRFDSFARFVRDYEIDAVIYHSWQFFSTFWDMCAIKYAGAAFIAHSHNVFVANTIGMTDVIWRSHSIYRQADAIVTLSKTDMLYWSQFNDSVFAANNPITFKTSDYPAAPLDGHRVLWLGRLDSPAKNAEDVLEILHLLLPKVPDVQLSMVGQIDAASHRRFSARAEELGLSGHISFPGYSNNVGHEFQKTDVFLATSSYEGYPMALMESLSSGVPVVCYEMPYLTIVKNSSAIAQVPWKDFRAAADTLAEILNNSDLRFRMGSEARKEAAAAEKTDLVKCWSDIFRCITEGSSTKVESISLKEFSVFSQTTDLAFKQMYYTYLKCCSELSSSKIELSGLQQQLDEKKSENLRLSTALGQTQEELRVKSREAIRLRNMLDKWLSAN